MFYEFYPYIKQKYFEEVKQLPAETREAILFLRTCEEIPIFICPEDVIPGWYGIDDSVEEGKQAAEKYRPTENAAAFVYQDAISPKEHEQRKVWDEFYCVETSFGTGHTCIDYGRIIREGLISYENRVAEELREMEGNGSKQEKKIMLEAMQITFRAVSVYTERFAALAAEMAEQVKQKEPENQQEIERLLRMSRAMKRVPMQPAENFYEAAASFWTMHSLIPISDKSWASISLGRCDQYFLPLYRKSLAEGMPRELAKDCLKNLFRLLDSYGDGACALNIGGMDAEGRDQMNELSELIIETEKELCLRAPLLVVRVHPGMPERILDSLIDEKLFQIGQPTFYGELPCRRAVANRGICEQEAAEFSVNSCMGLVIAGSEIADMWGCLFNMHLPLELAVNHGKPLFGELPENGAADLSDAERENTLPTTLEELLAAYRAYLRPLLAIGLDYNRRQAINCAVNSPNPLLSALTEPCIKTGIDRAVGARFNNVTVEAMGMINTGNAIHAIDCLVFQQKKYTIEELVQAAKMNYNGYEEIRNEIRRCDRYGTASKGVDRICTALGDILADLCEEFSFDNTAYIPSLHTLDANVRYGQKLYTTLDGRLAGEPVNKNAGPTNDVRSSDPTGVVLSAAALNQYRFSGGQPIDIYFDKSMFADQEKRNKIRTLVETYFELGGLQFQVNSVDPELLQKAYADPEQYRQVIVRIGGYSVRFVDLTRESQLEFIERFGRERGN